MLDTVLAYLKDPANRAILAWLGGGLVIIAGGIWTVFKFFAAKPTIRADGGGVVIGRDNTNSPITITTRPPPKP